MDQNEIDFRVDGVQVTAQVGLSILQACDQASIYIPRLCFIEGLVPAGACRMCTVKANGHFQSACTFPVAQDMTVENDTEELRLMRKDILSMLFVEGNHICPSCDKSGNCELQALAYRLGMEAPHFPYLFPQREVDASHPDIYLDLNRCILCSRCVRASRDIDGKQVFGFEGRGATKRITVNAQSRLSDTQLDATDEVVDVCPVGAILKKGVGFSVPVGQRLYDHEPIGSDIEKERSQHGQA